MNILITGVAGFLGFSIANHLIKKNNIFGIDNFDKYYSPFYKKKRIIELKKYKNFVFLNADINNKKKINLFIKNKKINLIMHFAAQAGVRYSFINPIKYTEVNILGFLNIVEIAKINKIKNVIYASSSSVYGESRVFPNSEKDNIKPKNIYSISKKINEDTASLYSNVFNINFIGLRFFTIYGEWGRPDMLIFKMFKSFFTNKKLNINNFGNHYRDFTYIGDVIKIIDKLINKKFIGHNIFNVCSNNPQNILKIIKFFQNKQKIKTKLIGLNKADVFKTHGDNYKIKKFLKIKKFTSFSVGFNKTFIWYKKNFKKLKL